MKILPVTSIKPKTEAQKIYRLAVEGKKYTDLKRVKRYSNYLKETLKKVQNSK